MQSRLAAAAGKFNRVVFSGQKLVAQRLSGAATTGRTADPAEHSVEPEEVGAIEAIRDEKLRHQPENETTTNDNDPYIPPKSPFGSSAKLESPGVGPRTDPVEQQKRRLSAADLSCAGIDGSPWPEEDQETSRREQREEQERDDREYFDHHKASPLAEIEVADTRKPFSRATDGTAQDDTVGKKGSEGILWRPEQRDTAEDSLRRAMEIFRWNAMRGDPDSPHGRVLREMRG